MTTEINHGTLNAYNNRGCRCEPCRAAGSAYRRKRRQTNPGMDAAANRRWRAENPDKASASQERARARRRIIRAEQRAADAEARLAAHIEDCTAAAAPLVAALEARARSLSIVIARAPRSDAATEARHRRAEIRDLLAHLPAEVTA